jgi:predicted dehydrogenase
MAGPILGVGIIGCGEAAQALHLPALNSLADRFRIKACADVSAKARDHLAAISGSRAASVEELLADAAVDVVVVCAPDAVHADLAIAACEAGKRAVLLEKPPALNSRLAALIADAAAQSATPVIVGYPHVYDAAVAQALAAIGDGPVRSAEFICRIGPNARYTGEILATMRADDLDRWGGIIDGLSRIATVSENLGVDVPSSYVSASALMLGLAIHDLPVLRRVVGEPLQVAYARVRRGRGMTGFGIDAVLELASGGRVLYQLEIQDLKMTDWGFEARRDGLAVRVEYPTSYAQGAPSVCTVRSEGAGGPEERRTDQTFETGFRREWRHLHDVVTAGVPPLTPIADAVRDVELAEEILRRAAACDPAARGGETP